MNTTSSDPALLVGLESPDDAAVYRIAPDIAVVQTVDFFTPIVDDPFAWGRIAAANAFSDVYAMGGRPVTALNLVGWPRSLGFDLLGRVIDGAEDACRDAGVAIVGGHSVDDPEPKFGLAVTGVVHPDRVVRKTGARPGADLVLTKALGTGIISSAIKEGVAEQDAIDGAVASMCELNRDAAEAMLAVGCQAATDVTGFGLMGHLEQMLGSTLSAELRAGDIPVLPGALELAGRGVFPGGSGRNRDAMEDRVDAAAVEESMRMVLYDAQTSGGLLIAIDPSRTEDLLADLRARGVTKAAAIGRLAAGEGRVSVA